jgi:hypothetical protein
MDSINLKLLGALSELAMTSGLGGTGAHELPAYPNPETELGEDLKVSPFAPGRFANAIQKNRNSRHALQVIREETTSSYVLDLNPDGTATVCRGWRYLFFNDGPRVHTTEHIREQLGYRGFWDRAGVWVSVKLALDDTVCPPVRQYSQLIPRHASEWQMRGLAIEPIGHPVLPAPALVCQLVEKQALFGEDEPHLVTGLLQGRWIVLGAGDGLRIKLVVNSVGGGEVLTVHAANSAERVESDSWKQSF